MRAPRFHAKNLDAISLILSFYEFGYAKCENHKISDIASRFSARKHEIDMKMANSTIGTNYFYFPKIELCFQRLVYKCQNWFY